MSGGRVDAGRMRQRVIAGVVVSSLALVGTAVSTTTSSSAAQSDQCQVQTLLPLPGDPSFEDVYVSDGDPTGRYLVGTTATEGRELLRALLWTDGELHES